MKLRIWRGRAGLSIKELAQRLECTPTAVGRYETGERIPALQTMRRIYDLSEGAVDANAFYDLGPARRDDGDRPAAGEASKDAAARA